MIKEFLSSLKTYSEDRLTSPILGSFTFAWLISNWKLVLFLVLSDKGIEDKISHIEITYTDWKLLLLYPALFVFFYTLILPWPTWWVQYLQENVLKKRRIHKLQTDTDHLLASLNKVEAQAQVEEIRLSHQIKQDIEKKRQELLLEREKASHEFEIEQQRKHMEYELEDRKREYEDRKQSRANELEHEKRMRELDFEERKRREEMDLERYKAQMGGSRYKSP